ncbi:MAG: hypothetical protein CSA97_00775 [Bacteroidetes bacterium]|nr:MAG: hypothetical protein CSA97_00775 [Bacteroidota bacterium]
MNLLSTTFRVYTRRYLRKIEAYKRQPQATQEAQLAYLLSQLARTHYGKSHDAVSLTTYQDFVKRVPLTDYVDLEPLIHQMRLGERNVLWPGRTRWFARSSGTTNAKSKFIPVTRTCLENCHYRGGRDMMSLYLSHYPNSRFFMGKGLTLGGSHQIEETGGMSKEGDLSAIILQNLPTWADAIRTPSRRVALLPDWEEKLAGIAKETIGQNVTSLSGVPSWNMVMIRYLLDFTGKSNLLELWPKLEVFQHGGVSFEPYREQYKRLIPSPDMHYMECYNASEGFFALQDEPDRSDMLLALDYGVFYEFIDMDDYQGLQSTTIPLWEVEKGRNYAMVISATNGLWRYIIGDTVTFTETNPYRIRITGRTKLFINAFGEEVIIDNAERAIKRACEASNAQVEEYTAGPRFMDHEANASHEWIIEFSKPPRDVEFFSQVLDNTLREVNSDYDAKRTNNVTLKPPIVRVVPPGTFLGWMAARGKVGGQNKVPRLANDRTHLESLDQFLLTGKVEPQGPQGL